MFACLCVCFVLHESLVAIFLIFVSFEKVLFFLTTSVISVIFSLSLSVQQIPSADQFLASGAVLCNCVVQLFLWFICLEPDERKTWRSNKCKIWCVKHYGTIRCGTVNCGAQQ